jgi:hypothetical protein
MKKIKKSTDKTINKSEKKISCTIYKSPSRPWEIMDIKINNK